MKSIIYVPQGRSARLTVESANYNIAGLFTDDYSSCQIIASVGKEKLLLMHIDNQMFEHLDKIKEEIEWAGEANEVFIITRCQKEHEWVALLSSFKRLVPSSRFSIKQVAEQDDGILVSFQQEIMDDRDNNNNNNNNNNSNAIHSQIQIFTDNIRPQNLLGLP